MAETKTNPVNLNFTSRVFPSAEDMALWNKLSPAERFDVIEQSEQAGFESGVARHESLNDRLTRVRRQ